MSEWMAFLFGGRKDPKQTARDAIVYMRQQLGSLERKEEHLMKRMYEESKTASVNAVSNKAAALAALRGKKALEMDMDRTANARLTLETQVNALEGANLNHETMLAMKRGATALKTIHQGLTIDKVDAAMDSIREQMSLANEISETLGNPVHMGVDFHEELKQELAALEQAQLDTKLVGAERAPAQLADEPMQSASGRSYHLDIQEEEVQLRALQAELAM